MYYLGVDGGNTKTDFALIREDGTLVDWMRTGTCSHEALPGGYRAAGEALAYWLDDLCARNRIDPASITDAVLGLAGVDTAVQAQGMAAAAAALPLRSKLIVNDSFLSIKAVSPTGCGVCSINGTGTVAGGIDETGATLQVGGIGDAVGDACGGGFSFAQSAVAAVYDEVMRCGPPTAMTAPLLALLGDPAPQMLMDRISQEFYGRRIGPIPIMRVLFAAADGGDAVALGILRAKAAGLADSVLGCLRRLRFTQPVQVITAGSVWAKAESPLLFEFFRRRIEQNSDLPCVFTELKLPPVCGALNWAYQRTHPAGQSLAMRGAINEAFADRSRCRDVPPRAAGSERK